MKSKLLLSAALLAFPTAATAAEAESDDSRTIIVTGKADGYFAENSVTATKTDTPLIDVPQTISVVTRERLDDQAQHSIADVLRYVPGTTIGQGEGNRDQITLRGQNTTADFFLDGVRDDVQYYRGLYNIERIEVLKGPFALIFGRGGSGGIINRVQKTPSAEALAIGGSASVNTFGAWDVTADINAPISGNAAFRLNANYESLDNHRDFFEGERYAINPYFAVNLGQWQLGLSYEYVNDDRVTDRGVPSIATAAGQPNRPITGYRDTFIGVPGVNRAGLEAHIVKARLDGELAENLNWSTTLLYGDYDKYYTNVFANGAATGQTGTVALSSYTDPTTRQNFIAQSNLVWDVNFGSIGNKILLGLEYGDQDSTNQRRNGTLSSSTLNLANIVYPTVTFGALARNTESDVQFFSAYAQDQISFGAHVDLVVGLRYDRFEIKGTDLVGTPRPFARTDEKVSPRVGLILKPRDNISVYGSYSRSFLPRSGDQFLTMSATQQNLAPERFTNYEVGAKWDIRPDLNVTLALFQLDRTNATTPDPNNVTATINVGETRTKGVELALTGRITPNWQVSGGYTYQDAQLRGNGFVRLAQVPKHQFALWNRYDFNSSVGAGIGVIHQSSQFAAIRTSATTTRLPAFTRVDAALFFKANERIEFQVNVENLLDESYFSDAHNNNNITPGAPINARFTARVKF
ncbi:MAG: TonB-dependent receptor [Sphingopyxis sp.]|jgi:catecholate siderophore receptor|uniref:TonB-dependent receptor n=1 Tax=unclassified Sphingopyxis TaxID=2614943 RepID=UPI000737362D|nr:MULTISPECIES: TonB-dependent siderophore receptor [unclassified Sphingopyxis]KTE21939.1 TonB-dependent receptor [Sphingopyxis sp. H050]MBA3941608.1 ferrichrome porin FhuA [Sphingopyxis sp.]MBR2174245.1 TonB-dependent siderophore receptor [Sphingopyxis sp.]ODU33910.1 MAG: TonB-dependent receptor [Sphingopyxis sp. SCN 67-31]